MANRQLPPHFAIYNALDFELLSCSGIYFLLHRGEVVYVGQSRNAYRRIGQHMVEGRKIFDSVSFYPARESRLLEIEARFIAAFNPKYNQVGTALVREAFGADGLPDPSALAIPGSREWVGVGEAAELLNITFEQLQEIPASQIARKRRRLPRSPRRVLVFNAADIHAYVCGFKAA